jgi:hypothetical protein
VGKQVGNAVRTAIWAVVFTAAVAFVLAVSMRGTGPVASGTGHPAPAAPVAESPSASSAAGRAAAAWSQFGSGVDVMVRAEDVQGLKGLMVLGEAPDNGALRLV